MSDRSTTPSAPPPGRSVSNPPTPPRFAIACEGHEVALPQGQLVLGRGSRCHIVVDDLLASREHARLTVSDSSVVVEDLGSTNGVYVNEQRIVGPTPVFPGDRIVIGTQELELRERAAKLPRDTSSMDFKDLAMVVPVKQGRRPLFDMDEPGVDSSAPPSPRPQIETEKADVVTTLGRLADRMLTMGRFDAAERVLQGQLTEVLAGSRLGSPVRAEVFEAAVEYGLRLAEVTRKGTWLTYVIEMHMVEPRVMEGPVWTRCVPLLQGAGDDFDRDLFFFYQKALQRKRDDLSLADRIVCDRILGMDLSS